MRLKTCQFSKNYFGYVFRRFFPYTIIMTLVLLAVNVLVYSMGNEFRIGESLYLIDVSIPTQIFMYIIPVILGCAQFRFLFTRNGADFFGSMPVTRAQLFNSNVLAGLASIVMVVGVNAVYLAVSMPLVHPSVMVAPSIYLWYFFYWVVAYGVTFAITAFAATLSGTTLAQLVLTFVTAITPGFFVTAFQNIACEDCSHVRYIDQYITIDSADMLIKVLFAPFYPIQQLFFMTYGQEDFTGSFYDIQTWPMLICNVIMLGVFLFASAKLLRRRKFELSGGAYVSEKFYAVVKILAVFPFAFFMWRIIAENGEAWLFFLFMIIITVFYIILDICLRKGLSKIKSAVITYFIALGFSLAVFGGICGVTVIMDACRIPTSSVDIKSFTVYMTPAGLDYRDNVVPNEKAMVKFTFSDYELIEAFKEYDSVAKENSSTVTMRVNVNGHSIFGRYRVSRAFVNRLYELMEEDENVWEKLDYTQKRLDSPVLTTVSSDTYHLEFASSSSYYVGSYNNFEITNKEAAQGLLSMLDRYNAERKISARYGYVADVNQPTVAAVDDSEVYYYNKTTNQLRATFVTYINGVYYTEEYRPSSEKDLAEFCKYLDMNAKDYLSKRGSFSVSLGLDNVEHMFGADFLGSNEILTNVCRIYGHRIIDAVRESETLPSLEDTVIIRIQDYNSFVYAPVSYNDVIKELVEAYLAESLEKAKTFDYTSADTLVFNICFDASVDNYINVGTYRTERIDEKILNKIMPYFSANPELYTSEGHLAEKLKGKTVVEITVEVGNRSRYHFYAYMNDELEKVFTDSSSPLFSNPYDTYLTLKEGTIESLKFDSTPIKEDFMDYFMPYVSFAITGESYKYYDYACEVYCEVVFLTNDGTLKEYQNWLVLDQKMYEVYSLMQKGLSFEEVQKKLGV